MTIYIWLSLIILFTIVEAVTPAIVSVWFALGAFFSLITAAFNAPLWVQIITFIAISTLALILTRPLVKRKLHKDITPTNIDILIGKTAIVLENINNAEEVGAVKIQGKIWSAQSVDGSEIPAGSSIVITAIEGVKLIVKLSQ